MRATILWPLMITLILPVTACKIESKGAGDHKDVKIETPFGGMKVNTDEAANVAEIGLAVYPGSSPVKEDKDNSADVDMHFGDFHLKVKAAGYTTPDSEAKVRAFYLKELAKFGDVLECRDKQPIGKLTKTREGLTCSDDNKGTKVHVSGTDKAELELKAGSKLHQHIVGIEKKDSAIKYGLVALDLPNTGTESN
ncbi:MAG: hypothetical protein P4M01_03990 [Acidobacteriota bacterium]|nr:hypothetical protein [Acidobacteriota bacterium]